MSFNEVVFYGFSTILVCSALGVVTSRNPVHAALLLVLAFFTSAAIWIQLQAEFLAITLILVYVGAVMVLFLFVVMMLDINLARLREGFWSYLPLGGLVALLLVAEMAIVLGGRFAGFRDMPAPPALPDGYSNTKELGRLIYTEYVYPFEIAAVILLVAIVAAIAITLRRRGRSGRYIDPATQVAVRRGDRVRIVQVPTEKKGQGGE
jgi:NADH-quinone oxidoreductase subunit J